jgi:hypothetical protein
MALVACCSLAWAAPPQGYQSRACGFDLNFNGVPGEPGDCNRICRGDPTNADIDGNGVADRQVYVNCSAGTDSTTCGAPGSPCRTLQYALNGSNSSLADHISSPATNQIQAVCFQGICGNAQVNLTQSGAAGTYTRTASGSEPRDFEFPRYPVIISGWDVNADGNYPPNSGETAVVDGNVSGNTNTFFNSGGHSRYEIAHFTIRDYGQACANGGDYGIGYPGGNGDVSHAYWHDLAIIDVNRGCNEGITGVNGSGWILWNNFTGYGNTLRYFAVVNTSIQNWGGFILRGSSPSDLIPSETSGPYRFQNVTATALPANGSWVFGFKPWSTIIGFDLLDSIIDANTAAYSPGTDPVHYAITIAQCLQDVVLRNNQLKNWKQPIVIQPSASGGCSSVDLDKITIDANEIRNTYPSWGRWGHYGIKIDPNDGSSSQAAQNITITNNFLSSTNLNWRSAILDEDSRDSGAITGTLLIAGNTIEANGAICDLGLIGLCTNGDCRSQKQQNVKIWGNILRGCQTNAAAIDVSYAPSGFAADWNVYDTTANWVWNGSSRATLASWRTALGGCPAATHDCGARQCVPSYVSASSGDYHLQATDTCARDAGFTLAGILDRDIDGQSRPGGASWDVGADEVVLGGTSAPAPPKLLDVEPLGP